MIDPIDDEQRAELMRIIQHTSGVNDGYVGPGGKKTVGQLVVALDARLTVAENQRDSWAHRTMFEQKLTEEMRAARDAAEKRASALNSDLAEIPARAWAVWNTYWKGERTTGIKTVQVMEAMLGTLENLADHFATAHAASSEPRSAEVQGETQPGAEIGPRGITGLGGVYDGEADQQDGGAKHA